MVANYEIKSKLSQYGIKQYELASKLGYSETHFSRKLRYELSAEERETVLSAICEMAGANREQCGFCRNVKLVNLMRSKEGKAELEAEVNGYRTAYNYCPECGRKL